MYVCTHTHTHTNTHTHTHTHRLRALQISNNAPVMVPVGKESDPLKIATQELVAGKVFSTLTDMAETHASATQVTLNRHLVTLTDIHPPVCHIHRHISL
jgi:hypothetical protein